MTRHFIDKSLCLVILLLLIFSPSVRADELLNPYYGGDEECGNASELGPNTGALTVGDTSIYQSGLPGPYSLEMWATHVLKNLSRKTGKPESDFLTQDHVVALVAFAYGEGGGINGNLGTYNMLNTKIDDEDLKSAITGFGVYSSEAYATRNFPTFDIGIEAATRTMLGNYQNRTSIILSDPSSTPEQFMEALTYFDRYPGNLAWATASIDGFNIGGGVFGSSSGYLNTQLALVNQVRTDYERYAGTPLDTPGQQSTSGPIPVAGDPQGSSSGIIDCKDSGKKPDTPLGNQSIVKAAEAELTLKPVEYDENVLKYTNNKEQEWAADFVSWVYKQAEKQIGGENGISGVMNMRTWFEENQIYIKAETQPPAPGDVAFFIASETPNGGTGEYVSIVVSYDESKKEITTIGGDDNGTVTKNTFSVTLGTRGLSGYGRFK